MDASLTNLVVTTAVPFFGTVLTGLAGIGVALAYKKLGLQQTQADLQREQTAQTALQGAMLTAAGLLATEGRDAAIRYVLATVPDAVSHFGLSSNDLATRIVAKAAALTGTPVAVGA